MIGYKLTDCECRTYGDTIWHPGKKLVTSGKGELCTAGWLHFYQGPLTADFMNPIHANFKDPLLWEVSVGGVVKDDGYLKSGAIELEMIRQIPYEPLTVVQRVAAAIIIAGRVYDSSEWNSWATSWLDGSDRSAAAAAEASRWAAWAARAVVPLELDLALAVENF